MPSCASVDDLQMSTDYLSSLNTLTLLSAAELTSDLGFSR